MALTPLHKPSQLPLGSGFLSVFSLKRFMTSLIGPGGFCMDLTNEVFARFRLSRAEKAASRAGIGSGRCTVGNMSSDGEAAPGCTAHLRLSQFWLKSCQLLWHHCNLKRTTKHDLLDILSPVLCGVDLQEFVVIPEGSQVGGTPSNAHQHPITE
ncbi:Hypothetical predicted protein [Podarcis lilfordi]|uniref:Uncharacterized protein n=1 Tax=Podarcis lilfordi TaxID=74358 RepID=A0AA35PCI3_9SAUR|nr:Hypothetical predicted protein [Podarcis lilfordi]